MQRRRNWYVKRAPYTPKKRSEDKHKRRKKQVRTRKYYLYQGSEQPIPTGKTTKEKAEAWARDYLRENAEGHVTASDAARYQQMSIAEHIFDFEQSRSKGSRVE